MPEKKPKAILTDLVRKYTCETCQHKKQCDHMEDISDCIRHQYVWWSPEDRKLCIGCPMNYKKGCGRHSEPCFKNRLFDVLWAYEKKERSR